MVQWSRTVVVIIDTSSLEEKSDEEVLEYVERFHNMIHENPGRAFMLGHGWSTRLVQIVKSRT